jgi:hypothetical protein
MDRVEEKQVHQTANDADQPGQHEVECLFIEDQFFAPAQRAPPVAVKKIPRPRDHAAVHPRLHRANLNADCNFDEMGL